MVVDPLISEETSAKSLPAGRPRTGAIPAYLLTARPCRSPRSSCWPASWSRCCGGAAATSTTPTTCTPSWSSLPSGLALVGRRAVRGARLVRRRCCSSSPPRPSGTPCSARSRRTTTKTRTRRRGRLGGPARRSPAVRPPEQPARDVAASRAAALLPEASRQPLRPRRPGGRVPRGRAGSRLRGADAAAAAARRQVRRSRHRDVHGGRVRHAARRHAVRPLRRQRLRPASPHDRPVRHVVRRPRRPASTTSRSTSSACRRVPPRSGPQGRGPASTADRPDRAAASSAGPRGPPPASSPCPPVRRATRQPPAHARRPGLRRRARLRSRRGAGARRPARLRPGSHRLPRVRSGCRAGTGTRLPRLRPGRRAGIRRRALHRCDVSGPGGNDRAAGWIRPALTQHLRHADRLHADGRLRRGVRPAGRGDGRGGPRAASPTR